MATEFRRSLERMSTPFLQRLHALPKFTFPIVTGGLLVIGLSSPNTIGGIALLLVAIFLGWLYVLSWPLLPARRRAFQGIVIGLVFLGALRSFIGV